MRRLVFALLLGMPALALGDDWPQWFGPARDGVWREQGILKTFPKDGPKVAWRVPIGSGYAGPAVSNGKVYVADRVLAKGAEVPKNSFDAKTPIGGVERVLCLDEKTGAVVWTHEYPATYRLSYASGPRCTPVIADGKVFALGAMGHLFCLDAATGKPIWSHDFVKEYEAPVPVWGFASSPLLDGDQVICLVGGNKGMVMAFDKNTGNVLWSRLTAKEPGYCAPILLDVAGKKSLIVWHSDAVVGLEPQTGKKLWEYKWEIRYAMSIATPRVVGPNRLFVSAFYNGAVLLDLSSGEPKVVWKSKSRGEKPGQTDGLHCVMSTPWISDDGHIYGICSYGEFRCLKAETGERVWETFEPTTKQAVRWGHAFIVPQGDRFFIFNELGDLIIAKLSPSKYEEIGRANILTPDNKMAGRPVVWSHPAFANRAMIARNDKEIVRVLLAE